MTEQGLIRFARREDLSEICQLVRDLAEYEESLDEAQMTEQQLQTALFGESTRNDSFHPTAWCHVVEAPRDSGARLAGFALWFLNFSTWTGAHGIYLEDLYVRPELRGHGYGKALLAELARLAVERGYTRVQWWVLDWNSPSLDFYRSIGATPMDEWTVQRLSGAALKELAGVDRAPSTSDVR